MATKEFDEARKFFCDRIKSLERRLYHADRRNNAEEVNSIRNMLRHCRTAVRALREPDATMYRWHDLKIDPDDLPGEEGLYAITVQYDDNENPLIGFGHFEDMHGHSAGWSATVPSYGKVIAWKKIRPYEGKGDTK